MTIKLAITATIIAAASITLNAYMAPLAYAEARRRTIEWGHHEYVSKHGNDQIADILMAKLPTVKGIN